MDPIFEAKAHTSFLTENTYTQFGREIYRESKDSLICVLLSGTNLQY